MFMANFKFIKMFCVAGLLLVIIGMAYHLRVSTWRMQEKEFGKPLMFTLESALLFRYANLALQDAIPEHDSVVEYPAGVNPAHYFSLGGEIFFAKIYKICSSLWKGIPDFERFYRYALPAYFLILSVPALFFIGYTCTSSSAMGLLLACWYAVALPAVIRSTGQEFMRENFALPILCVHIAFFIYALKERKRSLFWLSGLLVGLAWWMWDMTHMYLYVLAIFMVFWQIRWRWCLAVIVPVIVITLVNPYLRFHHAYTSVPVLVISAITLINRYFDGKKAVLLRAFSFVMLCAVSYYSGYGSDYNHFSELIFAKLRFFNTKPLDPLLLSFNVRVLWAPALHSATFSDILKNFGCVLSIFVIIILLIFRKKTSYQLFEKYILWFFAVFLLFYVFFVRVHVFTIIFGILLAIIFWRNTSTRVAKACVFVFFVLVVSGEYTRTLAQRPYMGRDAEYISLRELTQWINDNTDRTDPILASYNLAGPIVLYGKRSVILQPKFEKSGTREKYHKFLETLFLNSEEPFYNFSQTHGARYFVYEKGFSWNKSVYAPAYCMAISSDSISETLAARFEGSHPGLHKFYPVYENFSFTVFRIVSSEEESAARACFDKAERYLTENQPEEAETMYRRALVLFPGFREARLKLGTSLWIQGMKEEAHKQWEIGRRLVVN